MYNIIISITQKKIALPLNDNATVIPRVLYTARHIIIARRACSPNDDRSKRRLLFARKKEKKKKRGMWRETEDRTPFGSRARIKSRVSHSRRELSISIKINYYIFRGIVDFRFVRSLARTYVLRFCISTCLRIMRKLGHHVCALSHIRIKFAQSLAQYAHRG